MTPWPTLAPFGKTLPLPGGELFYYDSEGDTFDSKGDNDSHSDNTTDKPTIVLIHGLGDEADSWRHIFPLLIDAGYRVIAPDLPGFGRSQWSRINMRGHCKAVMHLMAATAAASVEKPAVLIGSSLGAGIAEIVACKQPDLVKKLILLDGCFPFDYKPDAAMFLMGLPFIGKKWYRSFRTNHEGAWKSLYPYYSDLNAMDEAEKAFLRERVIARVESNNQERGYFATLRSMNALMFFGSRSMAKRIKTYPGKITLLWGETDRVFKPKKTALLRRLRPDTPFTIIKGAGHLPHQEKPNECVTEMLRFVQQEKQEVI
jgi:pimeloyl-ACP methyl ester carboxylesterase